MGIHGSRVNGCSHAVSERRCNRPATWFLLVPGDVNQYACDEHREAVKARIGPGRVAGEFEVEGPVPGQTVP